MITIMSQGTGVVPLITKYFVIPSNITSTEIDYLIVFVP